MGKILLFPGVDLNPPSRCELVDEATDLMMKEILDVFVEHRCEPGRLEIWHKDIRDYFWAQEILLVDRDFRSKDIMRWRHHWRSIALDYIRSRQIR